MNLDALPRRREAELQLMLGAFGAGFLDHVGASITSAVRDAGTVTLTRDRYTAVLTVTSIDGGARSWTYNDLDAAIAAWLRYDGTSEPIGGSATPESSPTHHLIGAP